MSILPDFKTFSNISNSEGNVLDTPVQIEANRFSVNTDIGNMTTDRDDVLADIKGSRIAHTFHGDIDTTALGHFIDKGLDFSDNAD